SRAYKLRDNVINQISRDHSQVNDLIDECVITKDEADGHPLSNDITRAVGVTDEIDIDGVQDTVEAGDIFLLCSPVRPSEHK
ncbi:serine/threonine-protein phosphatase, partial [Pseudoalteromonas agarivorans]|uniref:PP2C family protein-serine/threonine phosphatase n=1 Tax=Pseudoalteromonas agarivorans TaxID=176102 RepID=UPI00312306BB